MYTPAAIDNAHKKQSRIYVFVTAGTFIIFCFNFQFSICSFYFVLTIVVLSILYLRFSTRGLLFSICACSFIFYQTLSVFVFSFYISLSVFCFLLCSIFGCGFDFLSSIVDFLWSSFFVLFYLIFYVLFFVFVFYA